MIRIVSVSLLLALTVTVGSEPAWAETMQEIHLEVTGHEMPTTQDLEDAEEKDEVVAPPHAFTGLGAMVSVEGERLRFGSVLDGPRIRPPRA